MVPHLASRAERKYPSPSFAFLRTEAHTMATIATKKSTMAIQSAQLKIAPWFIRSGPFPIQDRRRAHRHASAYRAEN